MFWIFPVFYLIVILYLTIQSYDREKTESSYFFSNYNTKWFESLISIVATETSVATILIFPAIGYKKDFSVYFLCAGYIIGRIAVALYYLKYYHKFEGISLYEYFSYKNQKILSFAYLLAKYISGGVRFYLAAFGISQITNIEVSIWLIIMTIITGIYSVSGGLKAIIKTDIIQGILIFISGSLFLIFIFLNSSENIKISTSFQFEFNYILVFVGAFLLTISSHGADQDTLQRVFSVKDLKEAQKSLILSGFIASLIILIFFFIGFYLPKNEIIDSRSPFLSYIANINNFINFTYQNEIIKGIFFILLIAAAMSTIDSSLHTTAIIGKSIFQNRFQIKNSTYSFISLLIMFLSGFSFIFISSTKDFLSLALGSMNYVNGTLFTIATLFVIFKKKLNFVVIVFVFVSNFLITLILTEILEKPWFITTIISFTLSFLIGLIMKTFQKN